MFYCYFGWYFSLLYNFSYLYKWNNLFLLLKLFKIISVSIKSIKEPNQSYNLMVYYRKKMRHSWPLLLLFACTKYFVSEIPRIIYESIIISNTKLNKYIKLQNIEVIHNNIIQLWSLALSVSFAVFTSFLIELLLSPSWFTL